MRAAAFRPRPLISAARCGRLRGTARTGRRCNAFRTGADSPSSRPSRSYLLVATAREAGAVQAILLKVAPAVPIIKVSVPVTR